MANRLFTQFFYSLMKKLCALFVKVEFGAGAIASFEGMGIADVRRTGAGVFEIEIEDRYQKFLGFVPTFEAVAVEDIVFQVSSVNLDTKIITVISHAAGVATDPSAGSFLHAQLSFNDSSVR